MVRARTPLRRHALGLTLICAALGAATAAPSPPRTVEPAVPLAFMRGMVVSCPRAGQIWGTPAMADSLAELETLGVEWVALHPYAWVRRTGEVRFRTVSESDYLPRAGEMIRAAGMRIFWKPHLGYWGNFEWRGAIEFGDETAWNLFFSGYRGFILDQARFAERIGAEIFALGVELELTTQRPEWRELISELRGVYSGQLTYAANWDRLDRVPFWNELDLIGVHAYFPLSGDREPRLDDLERGWDRAFAELAAVSARHGDKPVLFAEIGYNRALTAAAEPWRYEMEDSAPTRRLRSDLMRLAIRRIEREPLVRGMFWWKWIPGPNRHDRDFSMKDPEARQVLAELWGAT